MKNLRSTLAIVWRIASPYFRSDDKWAGGVLLASVIGIELASVGVTVLLNTGMPASTTPCRNATGTGSSTSCSLPTTFRRGDFHSASWPRSWIILKVYQLYLNQWLQIRWRRWMTTRYLGDVAA